METSYTGLTCSKTRELPTTAPISKTVDLLNIWIVLEMEQWIGDLKIFGNLREGVVGERKAGRRVVGEGKAGCEIAYLG